MSKKKILSILALSSVLCACTAIGACAQDSAKTIEGEAGKYEWIYEKEFVDEHDDFMTIDGKNDESLWENKDYFTHTEYREEKKIAYKVTTAFTTKGLYVYGEAEDSTITYNGRYTITENSGFTVLVAGDGVNRRWRTECLRLDLDAKHCRSWGQSRVNGKTTVVGEIGSDNTEKMTMEMFISWKALFDENSEEFKDSFDANGDMKADKLPERVRLYAKYRQVIPKGETKSVYKVHPTFVDKEWVSLYHYFGAEGYTQGEREDSVLGNAKNGLSKTGAWDLANAVETQTQKKISVSGRDSQAIYFKDVFAENLVVEATVTPGDTIPLLDGTVQNGQFGLIVQKSYSEFRAVHLKTLNGGTGFNSAKGEIILSCMTFYPNRTYTPTWGVATSNKTNVGLGLDAENVKLKLVKIGGNLAFFVNDVLLFQEYASYVEGECAPGLYTYCNKAVFIDYSAKAIAENEVDGYLKELGLSRVEITNENGEQLTVGGNVTANKYLYQSKEDVVLKLEPFTGYVISKFAINGEDKYEEFCANVQNGVYVIDRETVADGKISVVADYEYVVSKATRKVVNGVVALGIPETLGGNKILSGLDVHVSAVDNPQFYFDVTTDDKGAFSLNLCVAGTQLPNGNAVLDKDGETKLDNYLFSFTYNGKEYERTLRVDSDYNEELVNTFALGEKYELPYFAAGTNDIKIENKTWKYLSKLPTDGKQHFDWLATENKGWTFMSGDFDGIMFSLDTTKVGEDKSLNFDFELRNENASKKYRPAAVYALQENSAMAQTCSLQVYPVDNNGYIRLPSGFKGDILMLFEDFTRGNAGALLDAGNMKMISRVWFLAERAGLENVEIQLGDISFIDYAKTILDGYGVSLAMPNGTGNIARQGDVYTFNKSYEGVDWLLAGVKKSINHSEYDAFSFDVDTTVSGGKDVKMAFMFKNGAQQDNTRATVAYAVAEDGTVTKLVYRAYPGYSDSQIAIPANFKGKIVVLFSDVNYKDSTHAVGTPISQWTNLCSAIWMPTAGLEMAGVSFKMSNFAFIPNGAELVGQK